MNTYQKKFMHFMESRGLHVTRQRLSIAAMISCMQGHYTTDELYQTLRENNPGMGQATVYRTLKLLVEAGLVTELRINDGTSRFESNSAKQPHDHLVCCQCGAVVEIDDTALKAQWDSLAGKYGFSTVGRTTCFYGLCKSCREGLKDNIDGIKAPIVEVRL